MASSISSLGLGSSGVLSADVLDQLRAVDESAEIKPIEAKITTNSSRQSDLSILTTLTATLKSSTSSLADELSYLQRTATTSNTAVSVTAAAGTSVQDFSVHVNNLAQRDIYQTTSFALETSTFSNATTTTPAGTVVAPAVATTDGSLGTTESSTLSFDSANMSLGDTLTIGGLTLTATGTITQAEALAAFANLTSGATSGNAVTNGTWSGTLTDFDSGAVSGTSLTFTSITPDTNVTDLSVSATQQAEVLDTVPSTYTLSITIGDKTYDLDMTVGTTLAELKDKINDKTEGKATASILNVGGSNPYKLIIKATDTGADNTISFSSTSNAALKNLGLDATSLETNNNHLQTASDASFTFNGVTITRSTNTVSDLISGLTLTLNEKQTEASTLTNISVKQDLSGIKTNLTSLVSAYNSLVSNLNESTKYDTDTKVAGTFQSVSQVKSLSNQLRKQILSTDEFGRSLMDYGISLNSSGILEFDSTVFDTKTSGDVKDVEDFFRGSTTINATTFTGTSMTSDALNFASGDFAINGVNIIFDTVGGDALSNALALQQAINNAGITGVQATLGNNNTIVLKSNDGYDIAITGDSTKLASIGFTASSKSGQSTSRDGFFTDFNNMLASYITGTDSIFTLYQTNLTTEATALAKNKTDTTARLDSKYNILSAKFAAYDSIISKLNNQFSSLSLMINQSINGN
ncbi:MAG: flagellar filament capping protein FliD [Sulfurospirillaceae bacterium]|nr:flagellar filament capping protein FliD [Sulfurospirillaceae bacterium]